MRPWTGCAQLALVALALLGCTRDQAWTFHNGADLDDTPPAELLVEVYDSPECGFGCEPPGDRIYCQILGAGERGLPPRTLTEGRSYCFMGTSLNEIGVAYAIGCAVAEVGGDTIEVPLSRLEDTIFITRRCSQPTVMIDAGAGMDAGPPRDAGTIDAGSFDAGPAPVDAGPPLMDAGQGPPVGTPITVYILVRGPGQLRITGSWIDQTIGDRTTIELRTYVGDRLRLDPTPLAGARFVMISGGCGTSDPCDITLDRAETITVTFSSL